MSLDWDVSRVKNCEEVCYRPSSETPDEFLLNVVTDTLIWHTMYVGLGRITEKNVMEFFTRCDMWADVVGAPIIKPNNGTMEHIRLTYQDIINHIGLSTNVGNESKTKFLNRIYSTKTDGLKALLKHER